jgi:hypothetical protein
MSQKSSRRRNLAIVLAALVLVAADFVLTRPKKARYRTSTVERGDENELAQFVDAAEQRPVLNSRRQPVNAAMSASMSICLRPTSVFTTPESSSAQAQVQAQAYHAQTSSSSVRASAFCFLASDSVRKRAPGPYGPGIDRARTPASVGAIAFHSQDCLGAGPDPSSVPAARRTPRPSGSRPSDRASSRACRGPCPSSSSPSVAPA